MKQVSTGHVKITPDVVVNGGGEGGGNNMLSGFIGSLMMGGMKISKDEPAPKKPA